MNKGIDDLRRFVHECREGNNAIGDNPIPTDDALRAIDRLVLVDAAAADYIELALSDGPHSEAARRLFQRLVERRS